MKRIDPYDLKYGNPDWCWDMQSDGRKLVTSLLEDFRKNPDGYLAGINFPDDATGQTHYIGDGMGNGHPFAATLHDHADHTNLHVRWWTGGKEYKCRFKLTTSFMTIGEETSVPTVAFTLLKSGVYDIEGSAERAAGDYLKFRFWPCPCSNERVDMWWSLSGCMDVTMFHWALMPEAKYWMQLS